MQWIVREEEIDSTLYGEYLLPHLFLVRIEIATEPEADKFALTQHFFDSFFSHVHEHDSNASSLVNHCVVQFVRQCFIVSQTLDDKLSIGRRSSYHAVNNTRSKARDHDPVGQVVLVDEIDHFFGGKVVVIMCDPLLLNRSLQLDVEKHIRAAEAEF